MSCYAFPITEIVEDSKCCRQADFSPLAFLFACTDYRSGVIEGQLAHLYIFPSMADLRHYEMLRRR
jgi:hypothetical protein